MTIDPPAPQPEWAWFFDIDGTLARIEKSPDAVRVDVGVLELIEALTEHTGGAVALVSGRSLADIDHLFPSILVAAAGQHGAERRNRNGDIVRQPTPSAKLLEMRDALRAMEQRHAGLLLEDKGLSLALHYRNVPRLASFVQREVRALYLQMGAGFHMQAGKCVVEIVPVGHTKGTVVSEFMTEHPFNGRVPAFLGDDVTDESAFTVVNNLGGVSIKVGAGPTQAHFRLRDVSSVQQWLSTLAISPLVPHSECQNSDAGDAA